MNAKLYKTEKENYVLVDPTKGTYDDGYMLGTSRESQYNKLSIKNCETIERGYDLDELVDEMYNGHPMAVDWKLEKKGFKEGFKKALEILGDKKFSINEVVELCKILMSNPFEKCGKTYQELTDSYIQSLQQTEWEVEIEMEWKEVMVNGYKNQPKDVIGFVLGYEMQKVPKLDSNGCLILRRK